MKTLVEFALLFASSAHAGQKRRDGRPYVMHPVEVSQIALKLYEKIVFIQPENFVQPQYDFMTRQMIQAVALLHDVAEDTKYSEAYICNQIRMHTAVPEYIAYQIFTALYNLNKNNYKTYKAYVIACRDFWLSNIPKRADLMHNLSDLEKGSLRDKYELALHILEFSE